MPSDTDFKKAVMAELAKSLGVPEAELTRTASANRKNQAQGALRRAVRRESVRPTNQVPSA